jgi:hypothetical protein
MSIAYAQNDLPTAGFRLTGLWRIRVAQALAAEQLMNEQHGEGQTCAEPWNSLRASIRQKQTMWLTGRQYRKEQVRQAIVHSHHDLICLVHLLRETGPHTAVSGTLLFLIVLLLAAITGRQSGLYGARRPTGDPPGVEAATSRAPSRRVRFRRARIGRDLGDATIS